MKFEENIMFKSLKEIHNWILDYKFNINLPSIMKKCNVTQRLFPKQVLQLKLYRALYLIISFNLLFGLIITFHNPFTKPNILIDRKLDVVDAIGPHLDHVSMRELLSDRDSADRSDDVRNQLHSNVNKLNGSMRPLVTMFTTFKTNSRSQLNENTLRLWSSLRPALQPVLFTTPTDDPTFIKHAKELGWLAYEAPSLRRGYPVVKDMFQFIIKYVAVESQFIGYANSDIVFTVDLNETLTYLSHVNWEQVNGDGLLLVGKRSDIFVEQLQSQKGPLSTRFQDTLIPDELILSSAHSIDYFITTPNGYPFHKLPRFVVGKPGYDNYILVKALDWGIRLIDCSKTILALHQITTKPNFDGGWFSNNTCMNRVLVDPFQMNRGATICAPYYTAKQADSLEAEIRPSVYSILLYERLKPHKSCFNEPIILRYPKYKSCEEIVKSKRLEMSKALDNHIH